MARCRGQRIERPHATQHEAMHIASGPGTLVSGRPGTGPRISDYPFTAIELHLNGNGEGKGKVSLATMITADRTRQSIALEDYGDAVDSTERPSPDQRAMNVSRSNDKQAV